MKKLCMLCAVLLAGCGGGSGGYGGDHGGGSDVKADAFFAQVDKLVEGAPEDTEPVSVDAIAVTSPDDGEASAL